MVGYTKLGAVHAKPTGTVATVATVVVVAVVMLVVLGTAGSDAPLVVIPVVEGKHSEHWLHITHRHTTVQGFDCCRQAGWQGGDPASVVVVNRLLRTCVVVINVVEINAAVVVRLVVGNACNVVLVVIAVVTTGMTPGDGWVGSTTTLQSEQVAQVGQLHLMNQGCPFPTQY